MRKQANRTKSGPQKPITARSTTTPSSVVSSRNVPPASPSSTLANNLSKNSNIFENRSLAEEWAKIRNIEMHKALLDGSKELSPYVFHSVRYDAGDGDVDFETSCLLPLEDLDIFKSIQSLPIPSPHTTSSFIEVRPVPGRDDDSGLFATHSIDSGSVILYERPTLMLPVFIPLGSLEMDKKNIISTMFGRLPSAEDDRPGWQAIALRGLKSSIPQASFPEEGIIRTNGLAITLEHSAHPYSGVFLQTSRCNHRRVLQILHKRISHLNLVQLFAECISPLGPQLIFHDAARNSTYYGKRGDHHCVYKSSRSCS
jgi:hypothetical protein